MYSPWNPNTNEPWKLCEILRSDSYIKTYAEFRGIPLETIQQNLRHVLNPYCADARFLSVEESWDFRPHLNKNGLITYSLAIRPPKLFPNNEWLNNLQTILGGTDKDADCLNFFKLLLSKPI